MVSVIALPNLFHALGSSPRAAKAVSGSRSGTRDAGRSSGRAGRPARSVDKRTAPMEGVAETLYSVKNVARGLTPTKIREGLKTVASEAENVVSRCADFRLSIAKTRCTPIWHSYLVP